MNAKCKCKKDHMLMLMQNAGADTNAKRKNAQVPNCKNCRYQIAELRKKNAVKKMLQD